MAFLSVCVYLFFLLIRPQEWALLELAPFRPVLITQILSIIITTFELLTGKLAMPSMKQPWWLLMTGLFFAVSISNLANFRFVDAFDAFNEFGKVYLTFILIWINLNSVKRIEMFSVLLVALSTFIAVHCILLKETGQGIGRTDRIYQSSVGGEKVVRAAFYGIFGDPNDAAQLFVTALPFCVYIIFRFKKILISILYLLQFVTLMWGVYSTESRGGYIAMAATFFVVLYFFLPVRWFIAIAIVGGLTVFAFLPARLSEGLVDTSSSNRVYFWGEATAAFRSNPVFGVGYQNIPDYITNNKAVHNSFVQAYAEIGILGYNFWFIALAFSVFSMWRLSRALPDNKEDASLILWMKCIVPGIIGFCVAGYFLSRAYVLPNYVIMAMTAACYQLSCQKIGMRSTNQYCFMSQQHCFFWVGVSMLSLFVIYLSIVIFNIIT